MPSVTYISHSWVQLDILMCFPMGLDGFVVFSDGAHESLGIFQAVLRELFGQLFDAVRLDLADNLIAIFFLSKPLLAVLVPDLESNTIRLF